jgi:uncharacterized membrane protein
LTGIIVIAPVFVTIYLTLGIVVFIDSKILPFIHIDQKIFGVSMLGVPGMGVLVFIISTTIFGWLTKIFVGRELIRIGEKFFQRMPIIRVLYSTIKQMFNAVLSPTGQSFKRPCLVEFPTPGMWAIGFVTNPLSDNLGKFIDEPGKLISVFIPTTPNPTTGFLALMPESAVKILDISTEEAVKFVVSLGVISPENIISDDNIEKFTTDSVSKKEQNAEDIS